MWKVTLVLALVGLAPSEAFAQAGAFDRVPDETVSRQSEHFPVTNEARHDVYFPAVEGLGGAMLGVGFDPSYTLAAVSGAELLALVDYDPVVVRLHRAMVALLAHCEDVACLRASLEPDAERRTAERLARALPSGWESSRVVRAFRVHRPLLRRRIAELAELPSCVSRPAWYAHVHELARAGRIVPRVADLRGPRTLRALGRAARHEGLTFRVLYLSNAEEYFSYEGGFTNNLAALPTDARSVVLRTFRDHRLPRPENEHAWHYDVQPVDDLRARIAQGYADSSWLLRDLLASRPREGLSRLDASVPALGARGPQRWWLSDRPEAPRVDRRDGIRSRLLLLYQRSIARGLSRGPRRTIRRVELSDTGVARIGRVTLPDDPRTGAPYVLSGAPAPDAPAEVEPEWALTAMMFDALAREALPRLFERAGLADDAARLRAAPPAHDLYAAYRLRERVLERCPPRRRARGDEGRALRACRELARVVQPVSTTRSLPDFDARRARVGGALRSFAAATRRLAPGEGEAELVEVLRRLAGLARTLRASAAER